MKPATTIWSGTLLIGTACRILWKRIVERLSSWISLSLFEILFDSLCGFLSVDLNAIGAIVTELASASYNDLTVLNSCCCTFIVPTYLRFLRSCRLKTLIPIDCDPLLFFVDIEPIKCWAEWACYWLVTDRTNRWNRFARFCLDWCINPQWLLERLLLTTEWIRAFLNSETTVVTIDIWVSTRAVLAILNYMRFDIVADCLVDPKWIKRTRWLSNVSGSRFHLLRWLVPHCKSSIVISDVSIPIITALTKAFLICITLVD